jgi:hypothetical protein
VEIYQANPMQFLWRELNGRMLTLVGAVSLLDCTLIPLPSYSGTLALKIYGLQQETIFNDLVVDYDFKIIKTINL